MICLSVIKYFHVPIIQAKLNKIYNLYVNRKRSLNGMESWGSQRNRATNSVLWADSPSSDGNEPNNEAKAGKSGRAPKPGRILLSNTVPFLVVYCFSGRSRDGQRDTRANLEGSVQLETY